MRFIADGVDLPDELLWAHDEGRVVFFCGAGVSRARARLPDFNELTLRVLDQLGATGEDDARKLYNASIAIAEQHKISGLATSDRVFGLMRRSFTDEQIGKAVAGALRPADGIDLTPHQTILKLARLQTGETRLITTNFDRLFQQSVQSLKTSTRSNLPQIAFDEANWGVVHLHGVVTPDYLGPAKDGFVLSSAEFGDAYLASGWARDFVKRVLDSHVAVFVGYSADDPPIRYLLEGLLHSKGAANKAYAFQAIPNNEAVAAWDEKGVEAITFRVDDELGYDKLWRSLEGWSVRARNPRQWRQRILRSSRAGPRVLQPHERGQIAHIVSSPEGAQAFAKERPLLPSEWLCVFDPHVRFGEPGSSTGRFTEGPLVDPHGLYRIDSDLPPRAQDEKSVHTERVPKDAWSALEVHPRDLQTVDRQQLTALRGWGASRLPYLPPRISSLAAWIASVASQPACAWWAGHQSSLHDEILDRIRLDRDTEEAGNAVPAVADAWRVIKEYHSLRRIDRDRAYDLKFRAKATGWHELLTREYADLFAPYLKLSNMWRRPVPPPARKDLRTRDLVNVSESYSEGIRTVDVPDEYLRALVPKLRSALEFAVDLETRYSGYFDLCSIEPDEKHRDEGDDSFSRQYKLSGHVIHFLGLFRRLAASAPDDALRELMSWSSKDEIFSRMRLWALGNLDVSSASVFATELLSVDGDTLWNSKGNRDLLLGLARRWGDFSLEERKGVAKRLLKGRPRWRRESVAEHALRSAHWTLSRLFWLRDQGCELPFDFDKEVARLRAKAPEWREEYAAKAARAHDGGGGVVRVETAHSELDALTPEQIIPFVDQMETRPSRLLVERNPFLGLSASNPERALAALTAKREGAKFPKSYWETFLQREPRQNDESSFKVEIASALSALADSDLAPIALSASVWFELHGNALRESGPDAFERLWNKFLSALAVADKDEDKEDNMFGAPDWATKAINAPAGNLAELLTSHKGKDEFQRGEGLLRDWKAKAEQLLALGGDHRRHALVIFAFDLDFLYAVDPHWSEAHVLQALADGGEPRDAEAFWAGFFWRARIPEITLYNRLRPWLTALVTTESPMRSHHLEVLAGILLSGWGTREHEHGERLISSAELRSFLLEGDTTFRHQVLSYLDRWSVGEIWPDQVSTFLREVWPKQKTIRTKETSSSLVELALSQEQNFPEVAALVCDLVSKVDDDRLFIPELRNPEATQASRHPKEMLDLLHAVLPDNRARWPYGAEEALKIIGQTMPALRSDPKYLELESQLS